MDPIITLTGVSAGYNRSRVLHDISASLPARAISVILGPNGSGKTTLLRLLAGALEPQAGHIALRGVGYDTLGPLERARHVALVPQIYPPALPLTVSEALSIARYPHPDDQTRSSAAVEAALDALAIRPLRDKQCGALSGGELRRVLIAQGLVQLGDGPGVLLLDEPVAFLDPPAQASVLQLVRQLVDDSGLSIVAVLHDLRLAGQFAEHVLLLQGGTLLAAGAPVDTLRPELLARLYDCDPAELGLAEVAA